MANALGWAGRRGGGVGVVHDHDDDKSDWKCRSALCPACGLKMSCVSYLVRGGGVRVDEYAPVVLLFLPARR